MLAFAGQLLASHEATRVELAEMRRGKEMLGRAIEAGKAEVARVEKERDDARARIASARSEMEAELEGGKERESKLEAELLEAREAMATLKTTHDECARRTEPTSSPCAKLLACLPLHTCPARPLSQVRSQDGGGGGEARERRGRPGLTR